VSYLTEIIPADNRVDLALLKTAAGEISTSAMEAIYREDSSFIGCFIDREDQPLWARRAARYLNDEFDDVAGKKRLFGDVLSSLAETGEGKCLANFRHPLELWKAGGSKGVRPFSQRQYRGSCVDASVGSHECVLFGYRAASGRFGEVYKFASGWLKYAEWGYCSDGWNGAGAASAAYKVGCAFRTKYDLSGGSCDFTDGAVNENYVARSWCRSGVPSWLKAETLKHSYEDGAITRFQGGVKELRSVFANGGIVHTSGTRTSGGSRPFQIGRVGPHMQSGLGCDDSDEFRKFCSDVLKISPRKDDFPVIMDQTWGSGWSGEIASAYWPSWWGEKFEGAWVWWASDLLKYLSVDFVWLPMVKGFAGDGPTPPPPLDKAPEIVGNLYVRDRFISGIIEVGGYRYTATPNGDGTFRLVHFSL